MRFSLLGFNPYSMRFSLLGCRVALTPINVCTDDSRMQAPNIRCLAKTSQDDRNAWGGKNGGGALS